MLKAATSNGVRIRSTPRTRGTTSAPCTLAPVSTCFVHRAGLAVQVGIYLSSRSPSAFCLFVYRSSKTDTTKISHTSPSASLTSSSLHLLPCFSYLLVANMNYPSPSQPYNTASHTRYASAHASSSAFSASANPNEDWTKVSDLAERRRIQNRIAQRNYRKKLKRRLEDLERRAGSTSASPEQSHSELATSSSSQSPRTQPQSQLSKASTRKHSQSGRNLSPEMSPNLEESLFGRQTPRQLSASPPPPFSYSSYVPEKSEFYWTEAEPIHYAGLPTNYADNAAFQEQYYSGLLTPRPSVLAQTPQKEENLFGDDSFMNPFSMTYAAMTGMDVPSQGYMDFDPHVNATNFFDPYISYSTTFP
jgi:hypothetical protein